MTTCFEAIFKKLAQKTANRIKELPVQNGSGSIIIRATMVGTIKGRFATSSSS